MTARKTEGTTVTRTTKRAIPWLLTAALMVPMILAAPNVAAGCTPDAMRVRAGGLDPVNQQSGKGLTPGEMSALLDETEEDRYHTMQNLHDEPTLEQLDGMTSEVLPFLVGDFLYGGGLTHVPASQSSSGDVVAIVEETAKKSGVDDGELSAALLKTVLEITQADLPTLRTLIYLQEKSSHKDRWDFSLTVRLMDKCGNTIDQGHTFKSIPDKWGKDESGLYYLDFPLKDITVDLQGVELLNVTAEPYWCHSGWYSGKNYGCGRAPTSGSIQIKYV
jgi:hypothetical protein